MKYIEMPITMDFSVNAVNRALLLGMEHDLGIALELETEPGFGNDLVGGWSIIFENGRVISKGI